MPRHAATETGFMARHIGSKTTGRNISLLIALTLFTASLAVVHILHGGIHNLGISGISTASRTINQIMAVVITSIALVIPLTANLYTPKLVKLYVSHPLIAGGLSFIFASHILIMSVHFFPENHPYSRIGSQAISTVFLIVLAGALPYLHSISQFLRPSYFMPMLTRKGVSNLQDLGHDKNIDQSAQFFFETVDVVTNIALTGMNRGDRQIVLLSLESLHVLLAEVIGQSVSTSQNWRTMRGYYAPGLALEGQDFLSRERVWPEAYLLAQMLKVMESATKRQHEILSEVSSHLVDTTQLASALQRHRVVELHIMTFNTLFRLSIEEKDLRRFQNLSYHYRLLIEGLHEDPARMHSAAGHLLHYGRSATRNGMPAGEDTIFYDLGELVLSLASHQEERAVELLQAWAGPVWQECLEGDFSRRQIAWRVILRVYWEAMAKNHQELSKAVYFRFLTDEAIHREQLEIIFDENDELYHEFNDRLMRFAFLSHRAVEMAKAYSQTW